MWQINVAGNSRVLDAITEANREEMLVKKFIYPSSTLVYGAKPASEAYEDNRSGSELPPGSLGNSRGRRSDPQTRHRIARLPHLCAARPCLSLRQFAQLPGQCFPANPEGQAALPLLCPGGSRMLENRAQFVQWTICPSDFVHHSQE